MSKTLIIAEAGVNHNGSLELAFKLIDAAADAGADIVKFQSFKAEQLVSKSAPKAKYQTLTTDTAESQLQMLKKLELSEADHEKLVAHCQARKIEFLSTPFESESLKLLARKLNLARLKLSSGEVTNGPFLVEAARTGKSIILSTGMSTLEEVQAAVGALAFGYLGLTSTPSREFFLELAVSKQAQPVLQQKLVLLHCTTEYPAAYVDVNLHAMASMAATFGLPVGLSDHTPGINIPLAAVARGAVVIEKHFTIDKSLPGPDQKASLDTLELRTMIEGIRQIELALGSTIKAPSPVELLNREVVRKSLVAGCDIRKGELFTEKNVVIKRPGNGVSPMSYWKLLGSPAAKDYSEDSLL